MNAIKNTIVTVTLLIVGYGAYKILKDPHPNSFDAEALSWEVTPDSSALEVPSTELGDVDSSVGSTPTQNDLISRMNVASGTPVQTPQEGPDLGVAPEFDPAPDVNDADATVDSTASAEMPDDIHAPTNNLGSSGDLSDEPSETPIEGDADQNENFYDRSSENLDDSNELVTSADAPEDVLTENAGDSAFEKEWNAARLLLDKGQLTDALIRLSDVYHKGDYDSNQATRLIPLLDKLAGTVIYSSESHLEPAYQVQANESIQDIAKQYHLTADFVARINGIPPDYQPVSGETLKVVRGPFNADLNRQSGELTLYIGSYYAGRFSVKLGPELPAGAGTYQVAEKTPGREFFDRKSGFRIPVGDRKNPYGNYWIGLRGNQITAGHNVGIHVFAGVDAGCIGVSENDADDLTAIFTVGSKIVVIR